MEQKTNDEFMRNILIEEAWKEVSNYFSWSEALLEKYKNRVDWDRISSNNNIRWTIPMIAKFSKYINWIIFSKNANEEVLTPEVIETFKDNWVLPGFGEICRLYGLGKDNFKMGL